MKHNITCSSNTHKSIKKNNEINVNILMKQVKDRLHGLKWISRKTKKHLMYSFLMIYYDLRNNFIL